MVFLATGQSYEATFVAAIIPPAVAAVWLMTVSNVGQCFSAGLPTFRANNLANLKNWQAPASCTCLVAVRPLHRVLPTQPQVPCCSLMLIHTSATQQRVSWICLLLPYALLQQFREELSCRLRPHHTAPAAHPPQHQAKGSTTAAAAVNPVAAASAGPEPTQQQQQQQYSLWDKLRALVAAFKPAYWQALAVAAAVYFTRFDAAFLGLRAKQVGCCA
jgi:hypothetical protein